MEPEGGAGAAAAAYLPGRPKRLRELVEEEEVRDRQLVRVRGGACWCA
jgi:hypothetical protein